MWKTVSCLCKSVKLSLQKCNVVPAKVPDVYKVKCRVCICKGVNFVLFVGRKQSAGVQPEKIKVKFWCRDWCKSVRQNGLCVSLEVRPTVSLCTVLGSSKFQFVVETGGLRYLCLHFWRFFCQKARFNSTTYEFFLYIKYVNAKLFLPLHPVYKLMKN